MRLCSQLTETFAKLGKKLFELKNENRWLKRRRDGRKYYNNVEKKKLQERKRQLKLAAPKLPGLADAAPEASEPSQNDLKSTMPSQMPSQNVEELAVWAAACLAAAAPELRVAGSVASRSALAQVAGSRQQVCPSSGGWIAAAAEG